MEKQIASVVKLGARNYKLVVFSLLGDIIPRTNDSLFSYQGDPKPKFSLIRAFEIVFERCAELCAWHRVSVRCNFMLQEMDTRVDAMYFRKLADIIMCVQNSIQ